MLECVESAMLNPRKLDACIFVWSKDGVLFPNTFTLHNLTVVLLFFTVPGVILPGGDVHCVSFRLVI